MTGSRNSRKEERTSEEEQEKEQENKKDSQRKWYFIGKVLGKSGSLGDLGKSGNPGISFRRTHAIQGSRGKGIGWSS